MMNKLTRTKALCALLFFGLFIVCTGVRSEIKTGDNPEESPIWQKVRASLFQSRPITTCEDVISLDVPVRAEDAAIVPIAIKTRFPQTTARSIDEYTHVRVIAETNDGHLHMTTRFVKASGGCSAPPGKDAQAALANLGRMKFRVEGDSAGNRPVLAQLMISHPNNSGLAMDQVSRLFTPAHRTPTSASISSRAATANSRLSCSTPRTCDSKPL